MEDKTVFETVKEMNIDEFTDWLDKNFDAMGPDNWFDRKYCQNCEKIKKYKEDGYIFSVYSYCELHDCCKYFKNDKEPYYSSKFSIRKYLEENYKNTLEELEEKEGE